MGMKYNHDLEKYVDHLQSLSGNSDKETSAIDLLRQLCTLKKYKDVNGKDDYYKKSQPELWKKANYLASESEVKKEQPTDECNRVEVIGFYCADLQNDEASESCDTQCHFCERP